jgi:integrase
VRLSAVTQILGHSSINTTENYYITLDIESQPIRKATLVRCNRSSLGLV